MCVAPCVWRLTEHRVFKVHPLVSVSASLLFMAGQRQSSVWMGPIVSTLSSIEVLFSCFCFLAVVNPASVSRCVQVSVWT